MLITQLFAKGRSQVSVAGDRRVQLGIEESRLVSGRHTHSLPTTGSAPPHHTMRANELACVVGVVRINIQYPGQL